MQLTKTHKKNTLTVWTLKWRCLNGACRSLIPVHSLYFIIRLTADVFQLFIKRQGSETLLSETGGGAHATRVSASEDLVDKSSHGRGAAQLSELFTWGAQYRIRNMTSKKLFRASRPTLQCASPTTIIVVKLSLTGSSSREELNRSQTFEPKHANLTVEWLWHH